MTIASRPAPGALKHSERSKTAPPIPSPSNVLRPRSTPPSSPLHRQLQFFAAHSNVCPLFSTPSSIFPPKQADASIFKPKMKHLELNHRFSHLEHPERNVNELPIL
jgi:hypothetical protein